MYKVKVQQFEGPLDLLLQLIEEQKLQITEVALAEITEQYIQTLHAASQEQIRTVELADFLVVAARLLLIKSRALLPFLVWEEEEEEDLSKQLRIYREYHEASKVMQKMLAKKRISFSREKLLATVEVTFSPPPGLQPAQLAQTFRLIVDALTPIVNLPTDVVRKTISIQEKIAHIRERIAQGMSTKFSEILREAKDRAEVIVSFLALLELVKQQHVVVKQYGMFEDISILPPE